MDFIFDSGLVLYLPLVERDGSALTSKDACGHLGTVTGARWMPQGRSFDGVDDQISLGQPSILNITSQITVECWFKSPLTNTTGFAANMVVAKGWNNSRGYYINFFHSNGIVYGGFNDSGVAKERSFTASANTWYHVVWTYNGRQLILYVQGVQSGSALNYTGDIDATPADNFLLGNDGGRYGKCTIGEVRIYNRALTSLEVRHNYLATKWRYQ